MAVTWVAAAVAVAVCVGIVGVGVLGAETESGVLVAVGVKVGYRVEVGIEVDTRDTVSLVPMRLVRRQACSRANRPI